MRAGSLRHRITVTRPLDASETTQDSFGQDQGDPEHIGEFWCSIMPLQGRELDAAQQRWAEARYKITMRKQRGITFTRKMQAAWGERTLDILDVMDAGGIRPEVVMYAKDHEG